MIDISYESGDCFLCNQPLGEIRWLTRIPIFDPFDEQFCILDNQFSELAKYIKHPVHRDCWEIWDKRRLIATMATTTKLSEFKDAVTLAKTDCVGVWVYRRAEISFSHGSIYLPQSSRIYMSLLGRDVDTCEIRGRTPNLETITTLVKRGAFVDGFEFIQPRCKDIYDLSIRCQKEDDLSLKVEFESSHKKGINLTTFIRWEDLETLRTALLACSS